MMSAFYNWADKDWVKLLESNVDIILNEAKCLLESNNGIWMSPHPSYVSGTRSWKTFELIFFGMNVKENSSQCPNTTMLLSEIPEIITADFSFLPAQTHIKPHNGYSKMIVRNHLPLIVPDGDLGIKVDGEVRKWEMGKVLSFNDCLEHEAWNFSDQDRLVMMIDVPSPEYEYSKDDICQYKIENMDDPFLLSLATKAEWKEMYAKGEIELSRLKGK